MRLSHSLLTLTSMAIGAMAGCRSAPEWCGSSVQIVAQGYVYGWACDDEESLPCVNECVVTGSRQVDEWNVDVMKCCKSNCTL